ncbi:MFS transporter [Rhizobium sp. BK251]|uniref:MFS transporter n=1 Tax=Rhizobium sp. BK251 TaxID=2512125 RepID=UPI00104C3887|nr:MFS transporter [Rhizobium sp. BK251]TCL64669.1 putative MFS family arabinose efflux permease [Rhizobium sp. BK251]
MADLGDIMHRTQAVAAASRANNWRYALIAIIAFLTLVDLFAAQAVLPSLVEKFNVSRATMGFAVNSSTFGMAVAGLVVALFGSNIDRRRGVWISLAVLSIPTLLLAFTDDIVVFTVLRIAQGLCMSTAFTLTAAYLSEHFSADTAGTALAAYVTGNVASNLFGRILSASVTGLGGLPVNFIMFAGLNLVGALIAAFTMTTAARMMRVNETGASSMHLWRAHLRDAELTRAFAIGFLILFVFIGTYTYVNFRLVALGVPPMALGLVYLVFLPSILTTPLAGQLAGRVGSRLGIVLTLAMAVIGLMALVSHKLPVVLAGLALIAVGTFLAQAMATGVVGRRARSDKAGASGIYLASYYAGGLLGSLVLGQLHDRFGWNSCVLALVVALCLAIRLANRLQADVAPVRQ